MGSNNQFRSKQPTIKKAAPREKKTAIQEMNLNANYIGNHGLNPVVSDDCPSPVAGDNLRKSTPDSTSQMLCKTPESSALHDGSLTPNKASKVGTNGVSNVMLTNTLNPHDYQVGVKGLKGQKTGLDWLTLSFNNVDYGTKVSWLKEWFKGEPLKQNAGAFYKLRYVHQEYGYVIQELNKKNSSMSLLELSGIPLSFLDQEQQIEFLHQAISIGAKLTRLDAYVDFYGDDVRLVDEVLEWTQNPLNTGLMVSPQVRHKMGINHSNGLYLGSNQSTRFWRIYDKGLKENNEPNKHQRFELVLKDPYADQFAEQLVENDNAQELIRSAVFSRDAWENPPQFWSECFGSELDLKSTRPESRLDALLTKVRRFLPMVMMLAEQSGHDKVEQTFKELVDMVRLETVYPSPIRNHKNLIEDFVEERKGKYTKHKNRV